MEIKYLEKLNIRLENLNKNVINEFDKENYIKLFSDFIYSFLYEKDKKINYTNLIHFISVLLNGIRLNNKVYGGIKKIIFSECITFFENLIVSKVIDHLETLNFQDLYVYVPTQSLNSEINSVILGYSLFRLLREKFVPVKYISNLYLLNEISIKKKIVLFILDDYSFSGSNLLERIGKIKNVVSEQTKVFFIYTFFCSDTIHNLIVNQNYIPDNYFIYFHSIIFNYPVFKYNLLANNNSRFFCINSYYTNIFNFIDKKYNNKIFWMQNENTLEWYQYCKAISELMDSIELDIQKIISKFFFKYNTISQPLGFLEFYLPICHIITEYNEISEHEKNIFLIGKIQGNLFLKFIK